MSVGLLLQLCTCKIELNTTKGHWQMRHPIGSSFEFNFSSSALQVFAVTMALSQAFPTFDSGNYAVPMDYLEHLSDLEDLGALGDLDEVHSLSKRSPIAPLKPFNPWFTIPTLGLNKIYGPKINKLICKFTLCKNKKFGLVL